MTTIDHSADQRPTKKAAAVPGGLRDTLTHTRMGMVVMAKLAAAYRTVDGWVTGIFDWLGRAITRRTGWAWPGRGGSGVDEKARPVEAAAEVATERPPKPHRERARRPSSDRKQKHRDERQRAPTKPRQGMRERLQSFLARRFPRFAAMASAGAAKASRSGGQRQRRLWFEREAEPARAASDHPNPSQPRQTRKAQPRRSGSARAAAATGATPDHPAPGQRRPRFDSSFNLNLDIDELFQRGLLVPGARTHGTFWWPGGACPVNYVADLTDSAAGWLRLWFCTIDLKTGCRRTAYQQVWLTRMADGTWQFFHKGGVSRRLILRPGANRFRYPSVPGARRARERARERAQPRGKRVPSNKGVGPISINVDAMLNARAIQPGELRRDAWPIRVGDSTFPLRYESDLFDPANSRLWLCFPGLDKAGKPHLVRQEVVLAQGGERLWFVQQGRIDVTLTLRGDRFQIPRPPRSPSKPPCIPPQQPVQPCGSDMPSSPPQEPTLPYGATIPTASIQDVNDTGRPNSTQARRGGWLWSQLTEATRTVKRAVASGLGWIAARTCGLLAGISMRLVSRLGIVDRSRPAV